MPEEKYLFTITQEIVKSVEHVVLKSSNFSAIVNKIRETKFLKNTRIGHFVDRALRIIFLTLPFSWLGVRELLRPIFTSAIIVFPIFGLLVFTNMIGGGGELPFGELFSTTIIFALILVILSLPSTYVFDSISTGQIDQVIKIINQLGFDTQEKIEALEATISIVSDRAEARVKAYQLTIAAVWAIFLYWLNFYVNIAFKLSDQAKPTEQFQQLISQNLVQTIIFIILVFLSFLMISGLKKANEVIFNVLQFSIKELKYNMIKTEHQI